MEHSVGAGNQVKDVVGTSVEMRSRWDFPNDLWIEMESWINNQQQQHTYFIVDSGRHIKFRHDRKWNFFCALVICIMFFSCSVLWANGASCCCIEHAVCLHLAALLLGNNNNHVFLSLCDMLTSLTLLAWLSFHIYSACKPFSFQGVCNIFGCRVAGEGQLWPYEERSGLKRC